MLSTVDNILGISYLLDGFKVIEQDILNRSMYPLFDGVCDKLFVSPIAHLSSSI